MRGHRKQRRPARHRDDDVKGYEISVNRKKMLVSKGDDFYILASDVKASALSDAKALAKARINMSRWTFSVPSAELP